MSHNKLIAGQCMDNQKCCKALWDMSCGYQVNYTYNTLNTVPSKQQGKTAQATQ